MVLCRLGKIKARDEPGGFGPNDFMLAKKIYQYFQNWSWKKGPENKLRLYHEQYSFMHFRNHNDTQMNQMVFAGQKPSSSEITQVVLGSQESLNSESNQVDLVSSEMNQIVYLQRKNARFIEVRTRRNRVKAVNLEHFWYERVNIYRVNMYGLQKIKK